MSCRTSSVLVAAISLALISGTAFAQKPKAEPQPKPAPPPIRVSKKTTFVLGPLHKDGTVDFAAALNERASKGVTPEKNAAVLIAQVVSRGELSPAFQKALYEKLGIPKTVKPRQRMLSPWEFAKRVAGKKHEAYADALSKQQDESLQRIWSRKEMPELAAWLKQNQEPLAVVREAVRRPQWYSPIIHLGSDPNYHALIATPLPLAQSSREAGRALAVGATLAVREGRNADAIENLVACHRLSRLVGLGHSTMDLLNGLAIERFACDATIAILNSRRFTAKELERLQNDLDSLPPLPSCAEKVNLFERLALLDASIRIRRGGFFTLKLLAELSDPKDWRGRVAWAAFSALVDWNRVLELINEECDRAYAALKTEPYKKRKTALEAFEAHRRLIRASIVRNAEEFWWRFFNWGRLDWMAFTRLAGNLVTGLLMPAFTQVRIAEDRVQTRLRLVRIAVTLERYRTANAKYPAKLADLRPRFLKELPADLFTEKPFHYKPAKDGYLLYSVGPNMKDDGGKPLDPDSPGDADDIAVRVGSNR